MNELIHSETYLPDTIEDLTQFVLVGKARLNAYMLKIQNVNRLSMAQEIRDQTLHEAQELQGALFAAEQKIGEILLAIPKQTGNQYTSANSEGNEKAKSKTETVSEMGYTRDEASRYQQMAKNPDVVQKVLNDAVANGTVASVSQLNKELRENNRLKKELAEKDRKIKELESREPEVKTVVKEVVPEDYEDLKEQAKMADIHKKDFQHMRKAYDEMADKWKKSESEKQKLIDKANKPEEENEERLKISAFSFCSGMSNFLEKYGGYEYLMNEIDALPDNQRKAVYDGVRAIYRWANEMLNVGVSEVIE